MIETQALNSITLDDLRAWLAEHGLDISDVAEAVIRIDRRPTGSWSGSDAWPSIAAWLDVTWYRRDVNGHRFFDETGENAATGSSSIPLRSWPLLTPG